jgi:cysteine synthase A
MPDNASLERQQLIRANGARVVLTPAEERVAGAIAKAKAICSDNPGSFYPDSMRNPVNPQSHTQLTAKEIVAQADRPIHAFVAGAGSGGTLTGIARGLRDAYPEIRIFAASPAASPTLVAGVGAYGRDSSFPPVFDTTLIEDFIPIPDQESVRYARLLAQREGILAGPSSGMVVAAAILLAARLGPGHTIATVLMDTGERYMSTGLFDEVSE